MQTKLLTIIITLYLFSVCHSFYDANSPVIKLTNANFNNLVANSPDVWLIEFYAPWCGHCKNFKPEIEKAALYLKGVFKFGVIDCEAEKELASRFGIQGFPTVKFFGENKQSPEDYNGPRSAESLIDFIFDKSRSIVNKRKGGSSSQKTTTNNQQQQQQKQQQQQRQQKQESTTDDVIELNDNNFNDVVYNSKEMWMIAFYAPWCGHCQKLLPEWKIAATQLKGQINIAKVDATQNQNLANRFGIRGYPTIKIFPPGQKSDSNAEEYQGPRESAGIVAYGLDRLEKFGYVPEPSQIVEQEIVSNTCEGRNGICIISFLPHIADSSAKERTNYIEMIKEASKNARGKPIYYLWAQGGDFFDFEEKLNLSFGYPAVIAINYNKKKFAVCRNAFSSENLKDFVVNILIGKEPLKNLPNELPKLKKVQPWDGKDYVPVVENDDL